MNDIPPRSQSRYCGHYASTADTRRLSEILADCRRIALSSRVMETAQSRFELAVECYHQLMVLVGSPEARAELELQMCRFVGGFAERSLPGAQLVEELRDPQMPTDFLQRPTPPAAISEDRAEGDIRPAAALEVNACGRLQLAMLVNGLPAVSSIVVANEGQEALRDLTLSVRAEPGFADLLEVRLSEVAPMTRHRLDRVELSLRPAFFGSVTERMPGRLIFELASGGRRLVEREVPVELCAQGEWPGLEVFPELLAAFVLPKEPFVQEILRRAAGFLGRWTGDPSLSGYQSGDPGRVLLTAGAVYAALQEVELSYVSPPASFAERGQRVRLPREIGEHRLATCLDVALLAAACLEQAGLHTLLLVVEGHAFCGVWLLQECFPEPVLEQGLRVKKRVELAEIVVFDPTTATARPSIDFDRSRAEAERHLAAAESFRCGIDVQRARQGRMRPLASHGPVSLVPGGDAASIPATPTAVPGLELIDGLQRLRERTGGAVGGLAAAAARLDHWCRKLLDLSMRNRLLNFKANQRTIPLLCPEVAALEDALAAGRVFRIQPRPVEMHIEGEGRPGPGDLLKRLEPVLMNELEQGRLRADLDADELEKRLATLYREARTAMEEGGASSLFLAVGFLRFVEKGRAVTRVAPLLLLPVELTRASIQQGFRLALGGDEPRVNVTLLELLEQDHGIRIEGLDPLPEDGAGLDVPQVFRLIRERIRDEDRWELVEGTALGLFSFAKVLLWKDLSERRAELLANPVVRHLVEHSGEVFQDGIDFPDPESLDAEYPAAETICPLSADSSQLAAVFAAAKGKSFVLEGPPGTGKSQTIANLVAHCTAAGRSVLFVSEKMAALQVVHERLQKIGLGEACLELHSNKARKSAVLEQMRAALDARAPREAADWRERAVEVDRLRRGLNCYVEALHRPRPSGETVFAVLSRLIGMRAVPRIRLGWEAIEGTTHERLETARERVDRAGALAAMVGVGPESPLRGIARAQYTPLWEQEARGQLQAFAGELEALGRAAAPVRERLWGEDVVLDEGGWGALAAVALHLLDPPRVTPELLAAGSEDAVARARPWVEVGRRCNALRAELARNYDGDLASLPLDELERLRQESLTSWWLAAWARRRRILKAFRSAAREPKRIALEDALRDLARARALRAARARLDQAEGEGRALLGGLWVGVDSDWEAIELGAAWASRFSGLMRDLESSDATTGSRSGNGPRERCARMVLEEAPRLRSGQALHQELQRLSRAWEVSVAKRAELNRLLETHPANVWTPAGGSDAVQHAQVLVHRWLAGFGAMIGWCRWQGARGELLSADLAGLVEAWETGTAAPADARQAFERSYAEDWYAAVASADPELRGFYSPDHELSIARFRRADEELLSLTREVLRARVHASTHIPANAPGSSEPGILQRELTKRRRHMAIRRLFSQIPTTLRRLKPCVLMSPLSVAQYLDPSHPPFDLVVFDEASQIPIWDAIGAIARGRQAVIVGDPKQLPPTSFFDRAEADDGDGEDLAEDMESILDECAACNLPVSHLRWHYRSRHESLIAFSNREYYDNHLVTFPSCHGENLGVSWCHVPDGVFDRGRSRTNRREAEVVVEEVVRRLTDPVLRRYSIGVVAFSQSQQVLIDQLLEKERNSRREIEPFFAEDRAERVFVKNLENVQGDERDVVLFSIGYGPDAAGRVFMNFGPMNKSGGERRLNVAITRARREVVVISSLRADDIDLSRSRQRGVRDLKLFLDYAEHGADAFVRATSLDPSGDPESPFEEQVARALRERGWAVHTQVGCSGYRIDLAVLDPDAEGRYMLGVECDGATYHSAKTARDRDRLRQLVLERLGWRLHRIWSADWWRDPTGEVARIEAALEGAKDARRSEDQPGSEPSEPIVVREPGTSATAMGEPRQAAGKSVRTEERHAGCAADLAPPRHVYEPASLQAAAGDFYEPSSERAIGDALVRLVEMERPITVDFAARRVGELWGFERIRNKARERILAIALARGLAVVDDAGIEVLWPPGARPEEHRDFRLPGTDPRTQRAIQEVPTWEFANAAAQLLETFGRVEETDLMRETARLFGFQTLGSRVAARVSAGLERLVQAGRMDREGSFVRPSP